MDHRPAQGPLGLLKADRNERRGNLQWTLLSASSFSRAFHPLLGADVVTTQANSIGVSVSPPEVAVSGGRFSRVLRAVRGLYLGPKYEATIGDIQEAFGVSRRTAERIYAGQTVSSDTMLLMIFHEIAGPSIVQEGLARLPAERRLIVAEKIRDAAHLVRLQTEQEILAERMAR